MCSWTVRKERAAIFPSRLVHSKKPLRSPTAVVKQSNNFAPAESAVRKVKAPHHLRSRWPFVTMSSGKPLPSANRGAFYEVTSTPVWFPLFIEGNQYRWLLDLLVAGSANKSYSIFVKLHKNTTKQIFFHSSIVAIPYVDNLFTSRHVHAVAN